MKNNILHLPSSLFLSILFLSGCASRGPAFLGNTGGYMVKPAYNGQRAGAFYFSGRYNQGYIYYEGEKNRSFDLSGYTSLMWKHFYLSGGLYGYGGKYQLDTDSTDRISLKSLGYDGIGARFDIGGRVPLEENLDLLFGISHEFFAQRGKFEDETQSDAEEIFGDVFTFGLDGISFAYNIEARFQPSEKNILGLRYTWDSVVGDEEGEIPIGYMKLDYAHRLSLHATFDRVTAFGQIGFTDTGQQIYGVGLCYAFPFWRNR